MPIPRSRRHETSCGATPAGGVEFGLQKIPTVLIPGMQKKLLAPFRAQYRDIHQTRLESIFAHRAFEADAAARRQFRIANNAALAYTLFAHSNCGLISITIWPPDRDGRGRRARYRECSRVQSGSIIGGFSVERLRPIGTGSTSDR